jgi:hypothetical protein
MKNATKRYKFDKPAVYRIRVEGPLDESWSSRLSGMQIIRDETMKNKIVTILYGYLPDQPALSGVLNSLYDLGLSILSLECLNEE